MLKHSPMLLGVLALLFSGVESVSAGAYYATNLDVLGTGTSSKARGINDGGQVVGESATVGTGTVRAFLWDSTTGMVELPTLGGSGNSRAYGVNDSGQVVGVSSFLDGETSRNRAFLWDSTSGIIPLGVLGGTIANKTSYAWGINNSGQVTGYSTSATDYAHAFLWTSANGMEDLDTLGGDTSYGRAINDSGQGVGSARNSDDVHLAYIWDSTNGMVPLPTIVPPSGTAGGQAWAINNSGQVVGQSLAIDADQHAFLWDDTQGISDLGTLGGTRSTAYGVNNGEQVVGDSYDSTGNSRAFVWDDTGGMRDLNDWILPGSGWTLDYAKGINDPGQIVGYGDIGGQTRGFLLTPALLGDADLDGTVDLADLGQLLTFYNQTVPQDVNGWMKGDFDGDGLVDLADLGSLLTFYNQSLGGGDGGGLDAAAIQLLAAHGFVIPEPSTLVLLAAGLLGLLCYARRKRRCIIMKRFLILAACLALLGAASAQAEYIAVVAGERTEYNESLDKILFSIADVTTGSKVSTLEGTWMALGAGATLYMTDTTGGTPPDWIFETNRTVRNWTPPVSYCNFYTSNDAAGAVWERTGDGTHYTDLLTGSWYTSSDANWLGVGDTLAVMYVGKDVGVSFSGRMTVAEYAVGSTTRAYEFSVPPVPEPSTLALLAAGLAGLLCYAWRRRRWI